MPTLEKQTQIEEIRDKLSSNTIAILTEFQGLSVAEMTELRTILRNAKIDYKKEKIFDKFEDLGFSYKLFFYPFKLKQKTSIRIDFSFREKPKTKEVKVIVPFDYPITPYPLVVSLSKEEILAEKIRALFYRGKPRDLFDLWFLLTKQTKIDEKLIDLKFKYYPNLKFSFPRLKEIVKNYDENELKKDLNQFLPENYRYFYKQLKQEILNILK
ncbi:TPA: 50S ribosomal protein L10, partial [bacterium]|nr:50S ribosomal protein L10 [bacterium]